MAEGTARKPIRSYEDIEAYQRAMKLVAEVHGLVKAFPAYETYDLSAQMRRAAKSVPANIAEGYARRSSVKEFKNYLRMAMGSANEMEVHLRIAMDLGYPGSEQMSSCAAEYGIVGRQLNRLITSWRQLQPPTPSVQRRGE